MLPLPRYGHYSYSFQFVLYHLFIFQYTVLKSLSFYIGSTYPKNYILNPLTLIGKTQKKWAKAWGVMNSKQIAIVSFNSKINS